MIAKTIFLVGTASALATVGYFGWKLTARGAYESAAYQVLREDGPFEVREYPDLMLAATSTRVESQGDDGSFMRLFRYISGDNEVKQKVAMTTPVFMEPAKGEKDDASGQMGFVMPAEVARQGVPEPSNTSVKIRKRSGGRFAVIRFSGRSSRQAYDEAERQLTSWIERQRLELIGDAEYAGYDPPWTPGPFRRNEVLIRLR